jgi:hypothetical protein
MICPNVCCCSSHISSLLLLFLLHLLLELSNFHCRITKLEDLRAGSKHEGVCGKLGLLLLRYGTWCVAIPFASFWKLCMPFHLWRGCVPQTRLACGLPSVPASAATQRGALRFTHRDNAFAYRIAVICRVKFLENVLSGQPKKQIL